MALGFCSTRATTTVNAAVRQLTTIKNVLTAPNEAALRAWATANKAAAVRAVSPPPTHSAVLPHHLESLDAYLAARGWDVGAAPEARALASQALTYPLTIARHAAALGLGETATVAVVGARGEASLPSSGWAEMLLAAPDVRRWRLHFVGPEVRPDRRGAGGVVARRGPRSLAITAAKSMVATVADLRRPADDDDDVSDGAPDAVVLFNPGYGHHSLKAGWTAALDAVAASRAPALFTAHSAADLDRDLAALDARGRGHAFLAAPALNPFRSRKVLADPEDRSHLTCANYAAYVLRS